MFRNFMGAGGTGPSSLSMMRAPMQQTMAQGPMVNATPNARPGLFGGLANALRTAGRNYMAIDPQTRMLMGAGMMQGGLPGLAQGMLSGQELMQGREDRAFQLAERERQAAERAQAEADRQAFFASVPEQMRGVARMAPAAVAQAILREPEKPQRYNMPGIGVVELDDTAQGGYRVLVPEAQSVTAARLPRPRAQATGPATATLPQRPSDLVWGQ
jgi:hypothetical protein